MVLPASHRISRVLRYSGAGVPLDLFAYGAVTRSGCAFHRSSAKVLSRLCRSTTPRSMLLGLASFPFARRYLGNHVCFLFLRVLRCFSSPGALLADYGFICGCPGITPDGFPHSDIHGSILACSSPWLFAACRVLLRRLAPGHPPCALIRLIFSSLFS